MSLSTIRTEIKTILETISNVDNVHDYKRYTHSWADYKELFVENSKVNTWEIVRESFESFVEASNNVNRTRHNFVIRGFYAVQDETASEKIFQDIVEEIRVIFRDKPRLNDKAELVFFSPDNPFTGAFSYDYLGAVLCHIAELRLTIQEYETFT